MTLEILGPFEVVLFPENALEAAMLEPGGRWAAEVVHEVELFEQYVPRLVLRRVTDSPAHEPEKQSD